MQEFNVERRVIGRAHCERGGGEKLRNVSLSEKGASTSEYAIVVALLAVSLLLTMGVMSDSIEGVFEKVSLILSDENDDQSIEDETDDEGTSSSSSSSASTSSSSSTSSTSSSSASSGFSYPNEEEPESIIQGPEQGSSGSSGSSDTPSSSGTENTEPCWASGANCSASGSSTSSGGNLFEPAPIPLPSSSGGTGSSSSSSSGGAPDSGNSRLWQFGLSTQSKLKQ